MKNDFINVPLSNKNLDIYYIRKSIFKSLSDSLYLFSGKFLDVGCGKMPYKDHILNHSKIKVYHGLDIEGAIKYDKDVKPNFIWDGIKMPFENSTYESIMATEVLEHCPEPELVLNEVYRVLKPGGVFFFTVPFLWNLHEVPNDEYRFTPFALERLLKSAGFSDIKMNATGGWHASMAQMLGLWVRRSPMKENKRKLLTYILKPVIKYLMNLDKPEKVTFKEGEMITGIYGIIKK